MPTNIPKYEKVIELTPAFWRKKVGGQVPGWIRDDAKKGIMQNNRKGLSYKSRSYVEYKRRGMRRKTDNKMLGSPRAIKTKRRKGMTKIKPVRLKTGKQGMAGTTIMSRQTAYVDMTLTGQTLFGLRPIAASKKGVTMAYAAKDAGKVAGNMLRGYSIVGLNKQNIAKVKRLIIMEVAGNIRALKMAKDIKIAVSGAAISAKTGLRLR